MKIVAGILCAGLWWLQATAIGLAEPLVPSEDELEQALISGEIDYDQYLSLLEAIQSGIDPKLLDLEDLLADTLSVGEDKGETAAHKGKRRSPLVDLSYHYQTRLDESETGRSVASLKVRPAPQWLVSLKERKEYTGRDRFVERSLLYAPDSGLVKRLQVGTFSRKYGLGTAIGYRGRLFSLADRAHWESLLYPDYGSFNGAAIDVGSGNAEYSALASFTQSEEYSLATTGVSVRKLRGAYRPGLSIAVNRVTNRLAVQQVYDYKVALTLQLRGRRAEADLEYCAQAGEREAYGTVVGEVRLKSPRSRVTVAGWQYDRQYLSLSSGGRSGALHHQVTLDNLELDFNDRRAGQTGIQLFAGNELTERWSFESKTMYARVSNDSTQFQARAQLNWSSGNGLKSSVQYLFDRRQRGTNDSLYHRLRATLACRWERLRYRTTLGVLLPESGRASYSWLADLQFTPVDQTELQVWSHLARFIDGRIEYWSIFIKVKHKVAESIELATKLAERYSARSARRHLVTLGMEVSVKL